MLKNQVMIDISELGFAYGKEQVFKSLSIRFEDKVIGLIGENGAGKSTLVKLIIGLLNPSTGRITVNGFNVQLERNEVLKQIGVMFEDPTYPEWYTLWEHLIFVGKLRDMTSDTVEKVAKNLLKRFNLYEKRDTYFKNLSAGMKQKYAIATSLIGSPKFVLLDEPTANLDVKARSEILQYIHELAYSKGITVIILSHILHDLERICDRVVFLHKGEIRGNYRMDELTKSRFITDYSIKVPKEEVEKVTSELEEMGIEIIHKKGSILEIRIREKDQLHEIQIYNPVHKHSLLEQVFFEVLGDEQD